MTKKGKAKPRTPEEILKMRRRISAKMGHFQRTPNWTDRQRAEWEKLFHLNLGLSWALGTEYHFEPFMEADQDGG